MTAQQIGVVGGGVIGLSTALLALERGHKVTLYSDSRPLETTSAKAAASFKPHEVVINALSLKMLALAWQHFDRLAQGPGRACGVWRHWHWEASSSPLLDPAYLGVMENVQEMARPEVPGGYAYGRRYTTFFIDMPVYLPWMMAELGRRGGELVVLSHRYSQLSELAALPHDVVFNCTGLGARLLCHDNKVYPIKGQVAVVGPRPELDYSISADGFYVYPRSMDAIVGGTAEHHVDTETTDAIALSLLVRASRRICPDLTEASILRAAAGLRPYREESVRLEAETVGERRIVHNYGHGGAGVTLSWGSAELAVDII